MDQRLSLVFPSSLDRHGERVPKYSDFLEKLFSADMNLKHAFFLLYHKEVVHTYVHAALKALNNEQ